MTNGNEYLVAFKRTEATGGYRGIITWTGWPSKAEFDAWRGSPDGKEALKMEEVLEEGITKERALELVRSVPIECRITAAMEEATDPETGKLNRERMHFVAQKTSWVILHSLGLM